MPTAIQEKVVGSLDMQSPVSEWHCLACRRTPNATDRVHRTIAIDRGKSVPLTRAALKQPFDTVQHAVFYVGDEHRLYFVRDQITCSKCKKAIELLVLVAADEHTRFRMMSLQYGAVDVDVDAILSRAPVRAHRGMFLVRYLRKLLTAAKVAA